MTERSSPDIATLADRLEAECVVRENHPDDYCPDLTKMFRECVAALRNSETPFCVQCGSAEGCEASPSSAASVSAWRDMADAWKHRKILGKDKAGERFVMRWKPQEQPHHDKEGWFEQHFRRQPVAWMPLPGDDVAQPTTVTDEMVMAGARAMVLLGQDHRDRGEHLPSRLQEARACLAAAYSITSTQDQTR